MIAVVRWVAVVFACLQLLLYQPPTDDLAAEAAAAQAFGFVVAGLLAGASIGAELALQVLRTQRALRILGAVLLAVDCAGALGFVYLYAFDPVSAQWTILTLLPLEGALRFQMWGALGVWALCIPGYLGREAIVALVHDGPVVPSSITFRLGLLLVIALFAGFSARDLDQQRRALQQLGDASRDLSGRLEPAEMLGALCRHVVTCTGARSAIVYLYDGEWFQPLASWPSEALSDAMAEDAGEHEDAALAERLLTGPAWLDADDRHPRRLAVPLRGHDEEARHLVVMRPRRDRQRTIDAEIVAALAESAALALATTRVLTAERRSNRRLRYLEALRTRFVATVAHDLRLPLTVFGGVTKLLRRRADIQPERMDELLSSVERQASRLARLADDLLDAARLDADKLVLHLGACDVRAVIAAVVADVNEDVCVTLDGDLAVRGDAPRLERLLWNLLSNAEKYGRPPFAVGARRDNGHVLIEVRDHGTGLTEAQHASLFDDFAGSEDAASVGLGLAIVYQLATAHGGTVDYRAADPGACFTVALPVAGPGG